MKKFNKIIWIVFQYLFSLSSLFGQEINDINRIINDHPDDNIVRINKVKNYRFVIEGNKPKAYLEVYSEDLLMNDYMSAYESESVSYSKFRRLKNIEAWTLSPVSNGYKKYKVTSFDTRKELSSTIFHDDIEEKIFKYPELKKGAIKCLKEEYEFEFPELIDLVDLMGSMKMLNYTVKVEVDNRIKLNYMPFNMDSLELDFNQKQDKNKLIYTWRFRNLRKGQIESASTDYLHYAPHMCFNIDYYLLNEKDTNLVMKNVRNLYDFNYRYISALKSMGNLELKLIVDSISRKSIDEIDKAKNIYYWVKNNIKYIAFESGFQGYIPREVDEIYLKKYGDCKDMANIIHKMFKYALLDSVYLTWIGTDEIPYKIDMVCNPRVFNHMITSWIHKGRIYFLDATNRYTSLGYPSPFIQGKEAMISMDSTAFEIVKIPELDYLESKSIKNIEVDILGDTIMGKGTMSLSGYQKVYYLYSIEGLSKSEKFQKVKNYLQLGSNKFTLLGFEEINAECRDSSLRINFSFCLPNMVSVLKDKKYVNLFLDHYGEIGDLNKNRISGFKSNFRSYSEVNILLKIPHNYEVNNHPNDRLVNLPNLEFGSSFYKKSNSIELNYYFIHNFTILPKEEYIQIKDFQDKVSDILSESITLKKTQ